MIRTRTSESDPLRIATIELTRAKGRIGLTLCPGKHEIESTRGHAWARDLDLDMQAIVAWGASHLVTLLRDDEFIALKVEQLPKRAQAAGLLWWHLPITDHSAPDEAFESAWIAAGPILRAALEGGESLVIHCKGGLGRSGTLAARLLMELGECSVGDDAIRRVRQARPGAVDPGPQEAHVRAFDEKFLRSRSTPR